MKYKIPRSVLVIVYTKDLQTLLLERKNHPGFWQSVTGSQELGETFIETAQRELEEETGIKVDKNQLVDWKVQHEYEIFKEWRWRYQPGVTRNVEHVFSLQIPRPVAIVIEPSEHLRYKWMPCSEAADAVFSWSNAISLRELIH